MEFFASFIIKFLTTDQHVWFKNWHVLSVSFLWSLFRPNLLICSFLPGADFQFWRVAIESKRGRDERTTSIEAEDCWTKVQHGWTAVLWDSRIASQSSLLCCAKTHVQNYISSETPHFPAQFDKPVNFPTLSSRKFRSLIAIIVGVFGKPLGQGIILMCLLCCGIHQVKSKGVTW